ncbi:MAG TPA: PIN domain-containing protein [Tepidisphaeraceae bacterium]|nr:PIN domain-containing protein [Tepidisphaeraceae bacterium]
MILIDTSCWTHALRKKGNPDIAARVKRLLDTEEAAWCNVVRLELWHGVGNDWDRQLLEFLELTVKNLVVTADVWQHAMYIASNARKKGVECTGDGHSNFRLCPDTWHSSGTC